MSTVINNEIKKIISIGKTKNIEFKSEKAFDFLVCAIYCYKTLNYDKFWYDITKENITDGPNDGGIDFVYYDEENSKVIIGQNKYSENIDSNSAIAEIEKMINTIKSFEKKDTKQYSSVLKENFLNALDRLTEENIGNIDIVFSSLSKFKESKVLSRVEHQNQYSDLIFLTESELEKLIDNLRSELDVVDEFKFDLDTTRNELNYSSDKYEGIVVNISASSLTEAYNRFESKGLFNLNIRRYIRSKNVDDAIVHSINKTKDDFWFKNNGLTIACKDYIVDGDNIKIYNFSIVNGGQTTTLIAKNYDASKEDFFVMCKIIKSKVDLDRNDSMSFFNDIAEATNSQKPIQPRDLKANAPEMIQLQNLLKDKGYFLEIKRGINAPKSFVDNKIKNEDLAQIYYSFVSQKPGTARSNKKSLFSNNTHYKQIFAQRFSKNPEKINFIIDLIDLNKRVETIVQRFKNNTATKKLTTDELNILNNGKLAIIALMGFIYRLSNNDFDIKNDDIDSINDNFEFNYFLSNYKEDDIDSLIEDLIYELIQHISPLYANEYELGKVTSISNFLKTDKKYKDTILEQYIKHLNQRKNLSELIKYYGDLFKRN
ncbi:AIPR family protein [Streptococcus sp. CSL10205-OR2]|uniref:AIPR family protein n=1 Tax=Streptococcus sp. CSL10205-OR2 TaxID=2980558 RepID=UPI0021D7FFB5|nr:AIPR family protein [Streptococcus sp. CSL10205-OR2]MCU9534033.1 AIPR family protein [Streptococcus sp. CSL10205-OR2]